MLWENVPVRPDRKPRVAARPFLPSVGDARLWRFLLVAHLVRHRDTVGAGRAGVLGANADSRIRPAILLILRFRLRIGD
jgi:hypothetical protein